MQLVAHWSGRSFTCCLFLFIISMQTVISSFFLAAVFYLKWQIIGCIDDVMTPAKSMVLFNRSQPSTLCVKINWSKNTSKEREPSMQILFGAIDPLICPLQTLQHGLRVMRITVYCFLALIVLITFCQVYFKPFSTEISSTAQKRGCSAYTLLESGSLWNIVRDWIMGCGHWRGKMRQVDAYIEINLPYPNA